MKIKGKKTTTEHIEIKVEPLDVYERLKATVFAFKKIPTDWRVVPDRETKLPTICKTEYSYHNGDPYDVVVNTNPEPELVAFLTMWKEVYEQVRDAQYGKPNTD